MDSGTLHRHRELWGAAARGAPLDLPRLTPEEARVRGELADLGEVQLEQERIELGGAMTELRRALDELGGAPA